MDLDRTSIPLLAKALDVYTLRQRAIADNIANSETPGFRRREVRFEEELRRALGGGIRGRRTESRHLLVGRPKVEEVRPRLVRANDVDVELEMVRLTKNYLKYISAIEVLKRRLRDIKLSIEGRGGM